MIRITQSITIDESEIQEEFIRASGPGGQNVNKVSSAVQLRFNVANSPTLPDDVRCRLIRLARGRVTKNGVLIINARRFRTQERNRQDALDRLIKLIRKASKKPKRRRRTTPTLASRMRRREDKRQHSRTKKMRRSPQHPED